jgi:hypothetical protein
MALALNTIAGLSILEMPARRQRHAAGFSDIGHLYSHIAPGSLTRIELQRTAALRAHLETAELGRRALERRRLRAASALIVAG